MIDWLSILLATVVALVITLLETLPIGPGPLSQSELERRAAKDDRAAKAELAKHKVLPLYFGLLRIKVTLLVLLLIGILVAMNPLWTGLAVSAVLLLLVAILVAKRVFAWPASKLAPVLEPILWKAVQTLAPVLSIFAPTVPTSDGVAIASKDELKQLITNDSSVLLPNEKAHMLGSLDFGTKTIAEAMVPRSKIATVDAAETVGPLLLDRLHKAGHNVFVVVKKDLDTVAGLLYMSDLVPLDEDIKKVKDAMRPTVYFIAQTDPLSAVLAASLKTGRQFFMVVGNDGVVSGLITLADALEHAFGTRLNKEAALATDPKKLL